MLIMFKFIHISLTIGNVASYSLLQPTMKYETILNHCVQIVSKCCAANSHLWMNCGVAAQPAGGLSQREGWTSDTSPPNGK